MEVYKIIDPETGEESRKPCTTPFRQRVGEGVKRFRLGYGLSYYWELITSTDYMKAYRKVYSLAGKKQQRTVAMPTGI